MDNLTKAILDGEPIRTVIESFVNESSVKEVLKYDTEYGMYNNLEKDRKYFVDKLSKLGAKNIKVKKVRTDTPGLNMYEIEYVVDDENFVLPLNYL